MLYGAFVLLRTWMRGGWARAIPNLFFNCVLKLVLDLNIDKNEIKSALISLYRLRTQLTESLQAQNSY